jgi:hypothetical protein
MLFVIRGTVEQVLYVVAKWRFVGHCLNRENSSLLEATSSAFECYVLLNPLKAQWLIYASPSLTYQNSAFYPQSVHVRSIWFSQ